MAMQVRILPPLLRPEDNFRSFFMLSVRFQIPPNRIQLNLRDLEKVIGIRGIFCFDRYIKLPRLSEYLVFIVSSITNFYRTISFQKIDPEKRSGR